MSKPLFPILLALSQFIWLVNIHAQETVYSLDFNPALQKGIQLKSATNDTLELPFFDDFSNPGPQPNNKYWLDADVYINSHFEFEPISTGVATFDGLDANGVLYNGPNKNPYPADYLTSKSINLEDKTNVTLSFFYQPQGMGTKPEAGDSLILQFKVTEEDTTYYNTVWKADGTELQPFSRVYIPLEEKYLYADFQFRFHNYVSIGDPNVDGLGGNTDYWNLDYILLDENIQINDTLLNDVCFRAPIPPVLNNYQMIPWKHFQQARANELAGNITLDVFSYNAEVRQADVEYKFSERNNPSQTSQYSYKPFNLDPQKDVELTYDIVEFDFNSQYTNKAIFDVTCHFKSINSNANRVSNDTLHKVIRFLDYYAHDDGTPEAGYGFQGIGSENSMFAIKFKTYKRDTLKGMYIYFNTTKDTSNNDIPFVLSVWSVGNDGKPGDLLWEGLRGTESLSEQPVRYEVNTGSVIVENEFFIGWQQQEQNSYLNIGLDNNNLNSGKAYINTNGFWDQSKVGGIVMIRPSFDREIMVSNKENLIPEKQIDIYPNPAKDYLTVRRSYNDVSSVNARIDIISLQGQVVYSKELNAVTETIPLSLKHGIYLVRIQEEGNLLYTGKLIISKN